MAYLRLNFPQQESGNLSHQNLNVFLTCSSKSGIKDFYWVLKTDYSLTVSYIFSFSLFRYPSAFMYVFLLLQ